MISTPMNNSTYLNFQLMAGKKRGHTSESEQSSGSRPEGVYMSTDQILELIWSIQASSSGSFFSSAQIHICTYV